jgi:2-oxoisovalerate dehydrogenase E1 component
MSNGGEAAAQSVARGARPGLLSRLERFVAERHPFALPLLRAALSEGGATPRSLDGATPQALGTFGTSLTLALRQLAARELVAPPGESTPGVPASARLERAAADLADDCHGFLRRETIAASLTAEEKRELLRGMVLTRATDNRLKALFAGSELKDGDAVFQGKGFRSLGQEAIYAAPLRLRRGESYRSGDGAWSGDVVAPLIRDLGAALGMRPQPETVHMALNAQAGKAGPPMDGRDFHIGDLSWGILPPAAPLGISSLNVAGMALAFALRREPRVAVAFIGEGGSSLGEWHEAINLCSVRRLPAVFCVENNQTALSTPVSEQCAARTFADKAAGYGVPGITLDGTDPEAIAAAFAWGAERARSGLGPTLIELVCMRMCGHAHHDDMLYLGSEPRPSWSYPEPKGGYVDAGAWAFWAAKDPIATYARRLEQEGVIDGSALDRARSECEALVEAEARTVVAAAWPDPARVGERVFAHRSPARRLRAVETGPPFEAKGRTFLEAIGLGIADALRAHPDVFVYGEDVGGPYGNAFLLTKPLLEELGDRILNAPLAEAGILGAATGAALAGLRPIAEMQFNDFVATGFNQLVNNAAKIRYRWGGSVPMVVRMPWGGLRSAGPYHSQNTEPWFYRTPGLKIAVPSTPADARALLAAAVADPDPVLFYEHIALYRDPRIRQELSPGPPEPLPLGRAALRRDGDRLALVSYGAYAHVCARVAERLAASGIEAAVLDLRSLVPLDREALLDLARRCGKLLVVHEDSRTGGVGESLAALVQEAAFEHLDAPVRVLGALDAPVPYAPSLERAFLPSEEAVEGAARELAAY